jgi:hypothetical protein
MRYRDRAGRRCLESTNTAGWEEAQRVPRERLAAHDNNSFEILRKGMQIVFNEWATTSLSNYSKPAVSSECDSRR